MHHCAARPRAAPWQHRRGRHTSRSSDIMDTAETRVRSALQADAGVVMIRTGQIGAVTSLRFGVTALPCASGASDAAAKLAPGSTTHGRGA